jgi:hypothetical protein
MSPILALLGVALPLLQQPIYFVPGRGDPGCAARSSLTLSGLGGMFAMTGQVEVVHRWVDRARRTDLVRAADGHCSPMAIVNWSHVEDGCITRIRVTFDPRPMLG